MNSPAICPGFPWRTVLRMALLAMILPLCSPSLANAGTFTYNFTSGPFYTWFDSGCPPQCDLTGSMTFSQALMSNLPWDTSLLGADTVLSYSFTDGLNTFTQANSSFEDMYGISACGNTPCVATGSGGEITLWSIALVNTGGFQMTIEAVPVEGIYGLGVSGSSGVYINTPYGVYLQAGSDSPGSWSGPVENPSPVPEPSTLLLGLALLLASIARRKFPGEPILSSGRHFAR